MTLRDYSPWLHSAFAACAVLTAYSASAQRFDTPLSHDIDPREAAFYEANPYPTLVSRGETTPPEFDNLRTMAEWEEIEILCVGWEGYSAIEKQIVVNAAQECEVIVLTEDAAYVEDYITSNNNGGGAASMDNITVLEVPLNTVWIRDYGPNTVYGNGVDDRIIVDWLYNRPRPDDDVSPQVIADHMGIDLYETTAEPYDLMNTGGNFMSDGFGMGFASNLIGDENSGGATWWGTQFPDQNEEEIEGILADFMGLHTYVRMENLPFDGIHHIDMHMKLLDEETILMAEYPAGVADGPQIEANLEYVLSNHTSKWGTPFEVVRIPSPPEPGWGGGFPDEGVVRSGSLYELRFGTGDPSCQLGRLFGVAPRLLLWLPLLLPAFWLCLLFFLPNQSSLGLFVVAQGECATIYMHMYVWAHRLSQRQNLEQMVPTHSSHMFIPPAYQPTIT